MTGPIVARDPIRFHTALQTCASLAACGALFRETVASHGIVAFACGEIDLSDRERNVIFIAEWPDAWLRYYAKSGFIDRDPILNALDVYRKPFSFGDIIRDRRFFSRSESEVFRTASENGWRRGLASAVPRGGDRFGLVTLLGDGEEFDADERAFLLLISECLLTRVRALGQSGHFAFPPGGLSRRQVEAARLVALGHSDAEIAAALSVSASTAHKHVEGGRRRLRARNRAHMAALSVAMGVAA